MDAARILSICRIIGNLPPAAGAVWALVSWIWGNSMTALEQLGPPEYAAIVTCCGGALIALNWHIVNGRRPSVRFREAASDLIMMRDELCRLHDYDAPSSDASGDVKSRLHALGSRLRVDFALEPPSVMHIHKWRYYLILLVPLAEMGRIRDARAIKIPENLWQGAFPQ